MNATGRNNRDERQGRRHDGEADLLGRGDRGDPRLFLLLLDVRKMFSRTTMASSITIPTASASARSVIVLRV